MSQYEKEQRRLQALWNDTENDNDVIEQDAEIDNVSVSSDYADLEHEAESEEKNKEHEEREKERENME